MSVSKDATRGKSDILEILAGGKITIAGQFMQSSNYTFLADVASGKNVIRAVYKPQKGETPLWDFPAGTLCLREVAAFLVNEQLGWDLVPPTVFRGKAPLGMGALQYFVAHDPQQHFFSFDEKTKQRLMTSVLFDLIINNADRKAGHILLDDADHIWLIDHGTCFHQEFKYRTVVWDFAGQAIPPGFVQEMRVFSQKMNEDTRFLKNLSRFISPAEIRAMQTRLRILIQLSIFPFPDENRRTIPWPPI